jgi:hypothetical protein
MGPMNAVASDALHVAARSHPATSDAIDWATPIDRTRWFICETVTPLYYTRTYDLLSPEQRRRYNQLTAMFANELIAFLEHAFLDAVLRAVMSRLPGTDGPGGALGAGLEEFRQEERRHLTLWRRLNRLSDPGRYARSDSIFLSVPKPVAALARVAARSPYAMPVVFWIQLVQEERSVDISRRCARVPPDRLESRYRAVYGAHLRDETRHVQIDCRLIDRFYAGRSRTVRAATAALFEWVLASVFLAPGRSTRRVIDALVAEHPELRSLLPSLRRDLASVASNAEYQRMMYSRRATPITFAMLDRFPEFARLQRVLREYVPR